MGRRKLLPSAPHPLPPQHWTHTLKWSASHLHTCPTVLFTLHHTCTHSPPVAPSVRYHLPSQQPSPLALCQRNLGSVRKTLCMLLCQLCFLLPDSLAAYSDHVTGGVLANETEGLLVGGVLERVFICCPTEFGQIDPISFQNLPGRKAKVSQTPLQLGCRLDAFAQYFEGRNGAEASSCGLTSLLLLNKFAEIRGFLQQNSGASRQAMGMDKQLWQRQQPDCLSRAW